MKKSLAYLIVYRSEQLPIPLPEPMHSHFNGAGG